MNAPALLEHIEAECNNKLLCAGDLAENIIELIRASKGTVTAIRFENGCLEWPGGGMNLSMLRGLLARAGLEIVVAPGHCASCSDLRARLRNVYHLTLNFRDAPTALLAVREASGPGAPAPAENIR